MTSGHETSGQTYAFAEFHVAAEHTENKNIQGNNSAEFEKIQGNNSAKFKKIQGNIPIFESRQEK